jgi:transcriptional regulator
MPRAIEDADWIRNHVTQLSAENESRQAVPWQVTDAPRDYIDKLVSAIVGIEIPIATLVGKWKISQNRPRPDRQGVIAGLETQVATRAHEMAQLITQQQAKV